jgi:hypothetical protein
MGSVSLQVDSVRGWIGPSVYASQMPFLSDGDTSAGHLILLGDGVSSAQVWNNFYLTAPTLPANVLPVQLQTTWYAEVVDGSGSFAPLIIQCFPEPYAAGEVRLTFSNSAPAGYPVNFTSWNPAWPLNSIRMSMLANAAVGLTEVVAVLYYADPPSAHFSVPTTNGAVITDTVRPTVQWSYIAGDNGGTQTAYRIWLYTQAQTQAAGFVPGTTQAIWDSLVVRSSRPSTTVPINLANNTQYVAYLAVAQTVNGFDQWSSGYATRSFSISIPAAAVPGRPTVTATADSTNARAIVTVTQSGTPAWDHVLVEKSLDNGVTWIGVRSGDVDIAPGDTLTIWDYESPNGVSAIYRAQAQRTATAGGIEQVTVSQFSPPSAAVAWQSDSVWLKSPLFPDVNTTVRLGNFGTFTRRVARGVFDVLGRSNPIVVSDIRHGLEGALTVAVRSVDELEAIRFISDVSSTVLLQTPASYNFGSRYLALGDEHEDRINIVASNAYRWVQFDFVEVDAPAGDALTTTTTPGQPPQSGSVATWADVVTSNTDWVTLIARYPTWRDLYGFTVFSYSDLVVAQASWTTTVAAYADWNALIGIISPPTGVTGYLLDESGNILTDESGNRLTAP